MNLTLQINGLETNAWYDDDEIERVHKPLLARLGRLQASAGHRRLIVFLSAPPGTGKSTLTTFWQYLSQQHPELPVVQTLPMDGFHHYNVWLDAHGLRQKKGAPETFNVEKFARNLQQIRDGNGRWPQYDRQRHDPVEEVIEVTAPVVIVEGNWLLSTDAEWRTLREWCDFTLFIRAPESLLRQRLIARKQAGGLSAQEAQAFYARTDGPNVHRVLQHSQRADLTLEMTPEGGYRQAAD
ncbi:nucleoside/nucleotide kinase family protein [[Enterobacter] lignolyticus]|uniref:Fructose transport system kinase n=1 Tax=Enterobacter lignolyticus (strain SCF1) TaxID=701347 RepID=E3G485_ENTLS|nr:nucleoside/nucleotide kinase family protein [[Enterobacter] lignolyticus]ADO47100.1 putative fructose transport system kinase [[Enterobacter] lignolyticus SCF1]